MYAPTSCRNLVSSGIRQSRGAAIAALSSGYRPSNVRVNTPRLPSPGSALVHHGALYGPTAATPGAGADATPAIKGKQASEAAAQ